MFYEGINERGDIFGDDNKAEKSNRTVKMENGSVNQHQKYFY